MTDVSKEELLRQVEMWLLGCTHDTEIPYEGCKKCPSKKLCKQARKQIKEMIQKPEVTEEWLDEKAREVLDVLYKNLFYGRDYADRMEKIKDFFRKLVEEIK